MPRIAKNLVGLRFGLLLAVSEIGRSRQNHRLFEVACTGCGAIKIMYASNLRDVGYNKTSGCYCAKSVGRIWSLDANGTKSPVYATWFGMIKRCYSEKHTSFLRYGARGINVCDEWLTFSSFAQWMNENNWKKGLQIDRIDNDKGYSPDNCRIVTPLENANNRSTNKFLTVDGEHLTIAQASRQFGVSESTIKRRLVRGLSGEESVRGPSC